MLAVMEPCPPHLAHDPQPSYGGRLFHRQDTGLSGCQHCGWRGVPTITDGEHTTGVFLSTRCPVCEREPDPQLVQSSRVPRNQLCPCGSGAKAKRCDCAGYTV